MDKQEAIEFVRRELKNKRTPEEISALLSRELGAPPDLVGKFVAQIAAQQPGPVAEPREQFAPPSPEEAQAEPPGYQPSRPVEVSMPRLERVESPASPAGVREPWSPESVMPSLKPEFDEAEMENLILKALAKNRRQSDVVTMICERTGMNWGDAQRLVARVASKHRKRLTTRQNLLIIPVALLAILAGMTLLYAGISEAYLMGSSAVADPSSFNYSGGEVERAVWALPTGFVLLLGGGFGLYKALAAQFE